MLRKELRQHTLVSSAGERAADSLMTALVAFLNPFGLTAALVAVEYWPWPELRREELVVVDCLL